MQGKPPGTVHGEWGRGGGQVGIRAWLTAQGLWCSSPICKDRDPTSSSGDEVSSPGDCLQHPCLLQGAWPL